VSLRSTSHVWKDGAAKFVLVTGGDFSHGKEAAEASSKNAREVSFEISADLIAGVYTGEDQHVSYHFGLDLDSAEAKESVGKDLLLRVTLTKGTNRR
jgi:predicted metalloprotease